MPYVWSVLNFPNDENVPDALDALRRRLIEAFGNLYESYGLARLKGLLVGALLARDEPQSLDELAARLGRSKGPLSQALRELALAGLVQKADGPHARRDYYTADPDLFLNNFRRNMLTVAKNRTTAEHFLAELGRIEGNDEAAGLRASLEHMRAFYTLMEDFYARFEQEWAHAKPAAPPKR